ncbi:YCF48-related protein [Pseudomonas sp. HR96]|uniref:WD40/YVTN/BNR-like repeat-containing protein n=1 Tax=Pseudomonas sp. HR96 TaxID=1027966 RepID=UPI002A74FC41|nr:YCF48-related protein [Pseudomonas sp. HR96]WPP02072.1 YCF48-related protein [Pseudomonas sp. HR96]
MGAVRAVACGLLLAAGAGTQAAEARPAALLLTDVGSAGARQVAVGDRGQILLSDDQGRHWQAARTPGGPLLTAVYFVDDRHGWAVGHDARILASADGGASWTLQFQDPGRQAPLLGLWFADPDHGLAVGAYGLLLATDDGGAHWQDVSARLDNPEQLHLNAITAVRGAGLMIVGEQGVMFRSADAGQTWQRLQGPYSGSWFGAIATGQASTLLVYGLRGHLYRSSDFGASWQACALPGDTAPLDAGLAGATRLPDGSLVLVGSGGAVLRSLDDGRSFSRVQRPDRRDLAAVVALPEGLLLVGQGGAHRAANSGLEEPQP